ncbi:MAG: hypothetical protein IJ366_05830, partial [Clostridia bacterium]|nr:hypothetical protein [Clostridia bacterium]
LVSSPIIGTTSMTEGENVTYTTASAGITTADTVKVFVWDGFKSITPILTKAGILSDTFITEDRFAVAFENTDDYLYRVGNKNTVKLASLFKALDGVTPDSATTNVTVETVQGDASGTFTANTTDWTAATVQFGGTGVVKVTISDYFSNPAELKLEVVDGTNVTAYSELKNSDCVLLNDITMPSGAYALTNATLYGNGFTFDVTQGNNGGTGSVSNNYVIYMNNSILDNVQIVGTVYTEYGPTVKDAYNNPVVLSVGDNVIANSYIANCASPVRVNGGNLEVINTTLKGGNFANLDIRNGHVTLENVTTINQPDLNDIASDGTVVVGLGVVVYYENVLSTTTVDIKGTLKQYNHLRESDVTADGASQLVTEMFTYDNLIYTDESGTEWINTGVLSMIDTVGDDNITDVSGYIEETPAMMGSTGYVQIPTPAAPETAPEYTPAGQYAIAPDYSFDYTTKNYIAKTDGSNDYCYNDNGTVLISFDEGETFSWDTSILTVTKTGQELDYTVTMNGTDYTNKSITFNTAGNYTVNYTYTDSNNYGVDADGNVTTYSKEYTKTVHITVYEVAPDAKHAEFTFGSSGTASTTVTIGDDTYVMPTSGDGTVTIDGTAVNYITSEMVMSDGKTTHFWQAWKAYYAVFDGVVTITDYADGGTGDPVTYNSSTTSLPNGLTPVAYSDNGSSWTTNTASVIFKYQSSSSAPTAPITYSNKLYYSSPDISANRSEYVRYVKYSYTDNAGATYYYCVKYHAAKQTAGIW